MAENGGWNKYVLVWDWHDIALSGYPGWDLTERKHPPFVTFAIEHKFGRSSRDIAVEFDDIAEGRFYYRDWTNDGIPTVSDNEIYYTGFWFQKTSDRDRFVELYRGGRA